MHLERSVNKCTKLISTVQNSKAALAAQVKLLGNNVSIATQQIQMLH